MADELSQETLIGFLHDLGVALNFREDLRLQDTNVLNPEWVTKGVYRILNHAPLFQAKGMLKRQDEAEGIGWVDAKKWARQNRDTRRSIAQTLADYFKGSATVKSYGNDEILAKCTEQGAVTLYE